MSPNKQRIQKYLKAFDFTTLFREELGWDTLREAPLPISVEGQTYLLRPLVEKRGFKVYTCSPDAQGPVPTSATMRQIECELTKHAYEHLIIYVDAVHERQVWQWVKREPGKASATRLYRLHKGQSGELLSQKLLALAFSIEEEERLGTTVVAARVRQALDTERVTKKFYDRFQKEHATFLIFLEGITSQADCEWYASLMLNRLMFVYFIQKKGLLATGERGELDGDSDYLSHKLKEVQASYDNNHFYSFYRYFLLRLFHEGLAKRERSAELEALLGNVPYLNGGLFDVHVLEQEYPDIQISDEAFERIFAFFDDFDWHLDDRPLRNDREINPDVLGYIFEKYINQQQMGAYYTKEDITGYISKNTVIPRLLEETEQKCLIAFTPDGFVWSLLRRDPDRYIYEAMKHGCDLPLPAEIEVGMHDVSQRGEWNKHAPEAYALPTEIWREVVARRIQYAEVRAKLASGVITNVNDLITYNLDMCQFAQDVIAYSEGVDLLNAFYASLETITILDPTCGSGAFLFAALNILEPLYEACLDRMQEMVVERDRLEALEPQRRATYSGSYIPRFRDILAQVAMHPNRRYFILKSIIINNLYGVDIMEEAVEICKLRLFLKLVAQIDRFTDIEPLPDIDFNIRAGNTLVGFATYANAERAITSKLDFDNAMVRIEQKAQEVERAFHDFRAMQTAINVDPELMAEVKKQVRSQLATLNDELDRYLASEYGFDRSNIPNEAEYEMRFTQWRQSHQPFYWFVEFYGIMKRGGFDVIIGNPPYVEYRAVRNRYTLPAGQYLSESASNLYAFCMERSARLLHQEGRFGMIVPAGLLGLDEAVDLRKTLLRRFDTNWFSTFAIRPSKLFEGVDQRLCIHLASTQQPGIRILTTRYHHWYGEERAALFSLLQYHVSEIYPTLNRIPQIGGREAAGVFTRLQAMQATPIRMYYASRQGSFLMHYHRSPRYWIRGMDFEQYFKSDTRTRSVHHFRDLHFRTEAEGKSIGAVINSSLFFFWFIAVGNGRNITGTDVEQFPVGSFSEFVCQRLVSFFDELMDDYKRHSVVRVRQDCEFQEFRPSQSKPIIDEIERVLAKHYGFTDEELDFIINYDIKYRMGRGDEEDEGE
jgi:hypothetical protein